MKDLSQAHAGRKALLQSLLNYQFVRGSAGDPCRKVLGGHATRTTPAGLVI